MHYSLNFIFPYTIHVANMLRILENYRIFLLLTCNLTQNPIVRTINTHGLIVIKNVASMVCAISSHVIQAFPN